MKKRRQFDSEDEFDDTIPSGNEQGDFYQIYNPVFERFARYSLKQPVPYLGDDDTDLESVRAFYDFWYFLLIS